MTNGQTTMAAAAVPTYATKVKPTGGADQRRMAAAHFVAVSATTFAKALTAKENALHLVPHLTAAIMIEET